MEKKTDLWKEYGNHLKRELDAIDYLAIYNRVYENGEYDPKYLTRIVLLTLLYQEYLNKTEGNQQLIQYLNILKNEEPEEFPYDCLLYIIAYCQKINLNWSKKSSLDNLVMYC